MLLPPDDQWNRETTLVGLCITSPVRVHVLPRVCSQDKQNLTSATRGLKTPQGNFNGNEIYSNYEYAA